MQGKACRRSECSMSELCRRLRAVASRACHVMRCLVFAPLVWVAADPALDNFLEAAERGNVASWAHLAGC